jgi:hypothetical protein
MKQIFFALLILALASLACSLTDITSNVGGDSNVLFKDDFSSTGSGWDSTTFDDGSVTDYAQGGYRMYAADDDLTIWANPGLNFDGDVSITVDAKYLGGPEENYMGIICRYTEGSTSASYYFGIIGSDGWATIVQAENDDFFPLLDEWIETPAINKGAASNTIRFDCVGDTLTLYANGTQIATVSDSAFTRGDVGLIVGTFDEAGTDILFDNFLVTRP